MSGKANQRILVDMLNAIRDLQGTDDAKRDVALYLTGYIEGAMEGAVSVNATHQSREWKVADHSIENAPRMWPGGPFIATSGYIQTATGQQILDQKFTSTPLSEER